jgi:hypothetical protein
MKINNIILPDPKSIKVTKNKVWSKNTTRTADGTAVGDIICQKYKLEIVWALTNPEDTALIDKAVSHEAFFPAEFIDPATNETVTKTFYAGDPSYPPYSYAEGYKKYLGVSVNLIEQ